MKKFPNLKYNERAFTLIEMMVSVSLFLIVMTVVLGAVLSIIDGNKKTQAINSVSNNLSSAIENMIRDIKTGYDYKCGVSNTSPAGNGSSCESDDGFSSITFTSTISGTPRLVQYWLETDGTGKGIIKKYFCPVNITTCTPSNFSSNDYKELIITAPDVDVKKMTFYVKVPPAGTDQPGVFILIKGTTYINKSQATDFSLQTFISQRRLNI